MNGEIVGISTAIVAQGQGIGFAIPIKLAIELLPQLKEGKVIRGWIGIMIQDITPELAESFNLKESKGVIVADVVQDGPAEKAGLGRGDIIVAFNGRELENAHMLSRAAASTPPGQTVTLQVLRDGKPREVKVTIGTMPDEAAEVAPEKKETSAWGLTVQNITADLAQRFGLEEGERGVVVTEVGRGTPAGEARLRPGDVIREINRQKVQNIRDYNQAIQKLRKGESLLLLVKRGKSTFYVAIKPPRE
jgi:serine protease Do